MLRKKNDVSYCCAVPIGGGDAGSVVFAPVKDHGQSSTYTNLNSPNTLSRELEHTSIGNSIVVGIFVVLAFSVLIMKVCIEIRKTRRALRLQEEGRNNLSRLRQGGTRIRISTLSRGLQDNSPDDSTTMCSTFSSFDEDEQEEYMQEKESA